MKAPDALEHLLSEVYVVGLRWVQNMVIVAHKNGTGLWSAQSGFKYTSDPSCLVWCVERLESEPSVGSIVS